MGYLSLLLCNPSSSSITHQTIFQRCNEIYKIFTQKYFRKFQIYFSTECQGTALGMEHGHIKDADITASSTFDYHSVGPHIGR